jgi:excisionase family DNA binding protein
MPDEELEEGELLSTTQAARILSVDRHTVVRWITQHQLDAIRLPSGVYRIRRADIRKMLERGREEDL